MNIPSLAHRTFFAIFACMMLTLSLSVIGCGQTTASQSVDREAETRRIEQAAARRSPMVGQVAAGFSLPNQDQKPTALADFKGQWVVLYFYPEDDTPGCMCQATEFTRILDEFFAFDAQVVGVSPDSPASHKQFIKKHALGFPLLSDPSRGVMRQYGAWVDNAFGPNSQGRVIRTTFLIDPDGRIAWHWPEVVPQGHAQRVRDKLAELRAVQSKL